MTTMDTLAEAMLSVIKVFAQYGRYDLVKVTIPLVWSEPRPPTKEFPAMFPWEELFQNIWVGCHATEFTLEGAEKKAQEEFAKRVNECLVQE